MPLMGDTLGGSTGLEIGSKMSDVVKLVKIFVYSDYADHTSESNSD